MIDVKIFKKTTGGLLVENGFSKIGKFYYLLMKEVSIVIGFQKSSFADGYYINLGYVISELHPSLTSAAKDVDGDVRARFSIEFNNEKDDLFKLSLITEDELILAINENIKRYVTGLDSISMLKKVLKENPVMLYQTSLAAKQFLGID